MAKINRLSANYLAFAINALAGERTVFNDVTDSDVLDDNMTADFFRGWGIVGASEFPTKQDFNAAFFTLGQTLAYLHQTGVAEWDILQEYFIGSFSVGSDGFLYRSTVTPNIGTDPVGDVSGDWLRTGFSQVEIEAFIVATIAVTPIVQATETIIGGGEIATSAEVAAATDLLRIVPAGRMKDHPGVSSSLVVFDGVGAITINRQYDIASVVRAAAGTYDVTLSTARPDIHYSITIGVGGGAGIASGYVDTTTAVTTTTFRVLVLNTVGTVVDCPRVSILIGD